MHQLRCWNWEVETLKSMFNLNNYPQNFVNHCIKKFLNKSFIQREVNFIAPKRELTCVLQYLGKAPLDLRIKLRRTIEGNLPYCKLKIIFRWICWLNPNLRGKRFENNKSSLQYLNIQCTQNWCDDLTVVTKYSKSLEVKRGHWKDN